MFSIKWVSIYCEEASRNMTHLKYTTKRIILVLWYVSYKSTKHTILYLKVQQCFFTMFFLYNYKIRELLLHKLEKVQIAFYYTKVVHYSFIKQIDIDDTIYFISNSFRRYLLQPKWGKAEIFTQLVIIMI